MDNVEVEDDVRGHRSGAGVRGYAHERMDVRYRWQYKLVTGETMIDDR